VEPKRLKQLLDDHAAALRLYAAQWTEQAEDCVQEAFLVLVQQSPAPDNAAAWLYRAVRNRAISFARSKRRRKKREQRAASESRDWFTAPSDEPLLAAEARAALEQLPPEIRETVIARIWSGLSFAEIAQLMDVSISTAHRRYEAGLKTLQAKLNPCLTE